MPAADTTKPPARFNPWPIAIPSFFGAFVLFTVGLVMFSMRHRTELVAPDYYEQEIRYQSRLNSMRRTAALPGKVGIDFNEANSLLQVTMPPEQAAKKPKGSITFYRPDSAGLDRTFPLLADATGTQKMDLSGFAAGRWRVRVAWNVDGEDYYCEQLIRAAGPPR